MAIKKLHWKKRLEVKFLFTIMLATALFVGVFSFYSLQRTRLMMKKHTAGYGERITHVISGILSKAIKRGDLSTIEQVLESLGKIEDHILSIHVYSGDELQGYYESDEMLQFEHDHRKGILYVQPLFDATNKKEKVELGYVRVVYSIRTFSDFYYAHVVSAFISGAIFIILLSLLIYIMLRQIILRPLKMITASTEIVARGDLSHPIYCDNDDEVGLLADSFNEMTFNLKKATEEIEKWNTSLENKVKARTRELINANNKVKETQYQLLESSKMAAIGLIGMSIAHELNNPLEGIIGYVQLVKSRLIKTEIHNDKVDECFKYIEYIEKSSSRCRTIVDNILNYSRKTARNFVEIDIHELLDSTIEIMQYQIDTWNIVLDREYESEVIRVNGNSDRLEQVFINIIANAHTAMPKGGRLFVQTLLNEVEGEDVVHITFRDSGCGIAEEKIQSIFQYHPK